jgi:prolyl-tRNA synthetase
MEHKKRDFSEWYNEIIDISGLSDKRYPIKGMNVWMPYGYSLMKNTDELIRQKFYEDNYDEVMFPSLISRPMFEIEFEHIKGFEKELFWITKGGRESLEDDLAMRPTSESAIYPMLKLWIRDHSDLPKRIFQIVQVYRYETKHTRPFIRSRDIHFIECHTAHRTYKDSEEQMDLYRKEWNYFTEKLCLPYMEVKRPEWDKFPGAVYTIAFDTLMPSGRTLQIGTIHEYGTNFSKNYDVRYANENGESELVNQTTFGMSERLIAAIIGIHGDDKGLIIPPFVAPVQVVVVPIFSEEFEIAEYVSSIESKLQSLGIRHKVDNDNNYTPGYKFNQWEMKGVPLRIEIGGREANEKFITVSLRTRKGRIKLQENEINKVFDLMKEVEKELRDRAESILLDGLSGKKSTDQESAIKTAIICENEKCSKEMESKLDLTMMGHILNYKKMGKCEVCGKDGQNALFSRPY